MRPMVDGAQRTEAGAIRRLQYGPGIEDNFWLANNLWMVAEPLISVAFG